jgi:hypothetical protein
LLGKWLQNLTSFRSRLWEPNINVAHSLSLILWFALTLQIYGKLLFKLWNMSSLILGEWSMMVMKLASGRIIRFQIVGS